MRNTLTTLAKLSECQHEPVVRFTEQDDGTGPQTLLVCPACGSFKLSAYTSWQRPNLVERALRDMSDEYPISERAAGDLTAAAFEFHSALHAMGEFARASGDPDLFEPMAELEAGVLAMHRGAHEASDKYNVPGYRRDPHCTCRPREDAGSDATCAIHGGGAATPRNDK